MARPIEALRPLSGSSSAMRALPEAVVVGPVWGWAGFGGGGAVLVCGGSEQAPKRMRVASARRAERIGTKLRRTDLNGRQRERTSYRWRGAR
jgi:hypothetical protein